MSTRRTLARLGALTTTAGFVTLIAAGPASAHVTVTPSVTGAGSYTVLTVALSHGCDGSSTTALDVQIPEEILSVAPARSPFWTAEPQIEKLDQPTTDAHGNEVTQRVASVRFEATEPLPDGVRDSVELTFQIPDVPGRTLTFPTIQECEKGETAWTQVAEKGQSADELETPAPAFTVEQPDDAHGSGSHGNGDSADTVETADEAADSEESSSTLGWAGLGAGLLGLAAGVTALVRTRSGA